MQVILQVGLSLNVDTKTDTPPLYNIYRPTILFLNIRTLVGTVVLVYL